MGIFIILSGKLKDKVLYMKFNVVYMCSFVNIKIIDEVILKVMSYILNKLFFEKYVKFF